MFKRRECPRCKRKVDEKYSFCPHCGQRFESGKNEEDTKLPFGFSAIFNSLIKNMSKELNEELSKSHFQQKEDPDNKKIKREGISISISTFGNGPPKIKVTQLGNRPKRVEEIREKIKPDTFTKEKIKKFASLKREEPKTNIRRLSSKMIYEIEMPGVKSLEDVSILKLENSIEIKAISKNKAYMKTIHLNLPITDYDLSEEKLILELAIKG